MKIGILAGEASGDLLGAGLLQSLKANCHVESISGIGGPQMMQQGCHSLYPMERLSVMGFYEPLLRLPELIKIRRGLYRYFCKNRPDVFIGIDSPDFNLGLEYQLRKANIPVVHYVSPSVWAWRHKRIFKIAKAVDLVLTLFPFEAEFYLKHQVPVQFVGHPLADKIPLQVDRHHACHQLNLNPDVSYIALLPGSRHFELKNMASLMIQTAARCLQSHPKLQFITSSANELLHHQFQQLCRKMAPNLPIHFYINQSHPVLAAADAVLVTSGTATLETLLFKKPMVIVYRTGPITYQIAKRLIKLPYIGLPNLLANEVLVPEFIQDQAKPETLAHSLLHFLDDPEKIVALQARFRAIHLQLRKDANETAARAIRELK